MYRRRACADHRVAAPTLNGPTAKAAAGWLVHVELNSSVPSSFSPFQGQTSTPAKARWSCRYGRPNFPAMNSPNPHTPLGRLAPAELSPAPTPGVNPHGHRGDGGQWLEVCQRPAVRRMDRSVARPVQLGRQGATGAHRLGHQPERITKAGDAYLRSLLVLGARAVLNAAAGKTDSLIRSAAGRSSWPNDVGTGRRWWPLPQRIGTAHCGPARWVVLGAGG